MSHASVRVRIAPSPTGYLHVGTARMAIFNYLFARHYGGRFLVRIEDTDPERSRAELIDPILSALQWLGISWDEEIVYQSARLDHYRQFARRLLESGHAYPCFCSPELLAEMRQQARADKRPTQYDRRCLRLPADEVKKALADAGRPCAIRIRIPDGQTAYTDMISGELSRENTEIEDFIIARSDGSATYNLAVVIDDHDMGITHVVRGNDHITNTFKQIHIYRALGWEVPAFGHVPLILRPDKRKVSKRLGDKDVSEYRREGVLPEPLFNYLSLLGWSPKTDREIYTRSELIEIFDENNANRSNAVFDEEKLLAFNFEYMQRMTEHELATLVAPLLVEAGVTTRYWLETRWDYLREVVRLFKPRVRRLTDFAVLGGYFFSFDYRYDAAAEEKHFSAEAGRLLSDLADCLEALPEFTVESTEQAVGATAEEKGIKRARLIHAVRLAVSGTPAGPGLFEMLASLGRPVVLERLRKGAAYIRRKYGQ
ncbi:MAG TPA: glutamate--tRNA ligase [Acidobacteriota bacterium]|nr:glutamate--tRNA ligase [Acidobacteriota bacterium]